MNGYCYHYDGSYAGFLTCIFEIYDKKEPPAMFLLPDDQRPSLYENRWVETDEDLARRVRARLGVRLGRKGLLMVEEGFLTCMENKEQRLYWLIDLGLRVGPGVEKHLEDFNLLQVGKAIRHLQRECQLLTGFTRFSEVDGVLVGEITPKNWVLPILQVHFCDRFAEFPFFLFDKTHNQLLIHKPGGGPKGQWAILPAGDFHIPPPDQREETFRNLWRRFYDTIAIQPRYNPKCRQTHMPKRYWGDMTEFQREETPHSGSGSLCIAEKV